MARPKPLVLVILDGWGHHPDAHGNAVALARKPNFDSFLAKYPHTLIHTSGPFVGLPEGQMGNSEVGHLNIGAGRIIHMDITRLDLAIAGGEFFHQPLLLQAMERGRRRQLHLLGLVSDGGVHSHQEHLYALLRMAAEQKVERVFVHCFMDGRDTPPESGAAFLEALQQQMRKFHVGRIATVSGRYYAMDRDQRWERTERAYRAMTAGDGLRAADPVAAVRASYGRGVTDEFLEPVVIAGERNEPVGVIHEEDAVVFFNFRADRARQMTRLLLEKGPRDLLIATMTEYDKTLPVPFVLPREFPENILANIFAGEGLRNLRVAETEKYAHVTYFFNGGNEKPYGGEERILVPSPKVATYDLKPEMSAAGIAETVVKSVEGGAFDVLVVNFANADMVGHSGKLEPTIRAVETVDGCLGEIYQAVRARGGAMLVTADHGNAEVMIDPETGGPHTYHTTNPVPFLLICGGPPAALRQDGSLRDLAPTVLGVLGLPQPKEMTGRDLRVCS
jgi:2,3-bisphosphoglycerate-independent phosphoglycerate mutase